jgi:hypothetical protein
LATSTCAISASVGRPPSTIRAGAWACTTALARTAAIARTAGDEDTEGGWHHIEAFGYILADLVERAAAARAGPNAINFLDIDDLLDPFEMGWERTPVGLTWALSGSPACLGAGMLGFGQRRLDFFQSKLKLIGIELL